MNAERLFVLGDPRVNEVWRNRKAQTICGNLKLIISESGAFSSWIDSLPLAQYSSKTSPGGISGVVRRGTVSRCEEDRDCNASGKK